MTHLLRKINRIIDICEICFYILFELYIISSFRHAVQFTHFFSFPAVIVFKIAGVENDPFSFPFCKGKNNNARLGKNEWDQMHRKVIDWGVRFQAKYPSAIYSIREG